jgi:hypothetical protein
MWSDTFKYPSEWTADLESAKKNIEHIKNRIRILMSSNENMFEVMSKEKDKVKSFYSGDKLIETLTENTDPVKFA